MPVALYMDEQVPMELTLQLRLRDVDVLTTQDADMLGAFDEEDLGRALYTEDRDFLAIGADWQRARKEFYGIIYAHPLNVSFSVRFAELHLIAEAGNSLDYINWIEHLPIRVR